MSSHGDGNAHETDDGRIATVDVANFEILAAIREPGCALCRVEALAERRLMQGFLREGRYNPATRETFMRSGGFCHRHAWQLHHEAEEGATGAGIADIYGQLIGRDVARLDTASQRLATRRGRRHVRRSFRRQARCQLCVALARARQSHGYFLGQLLGDEGAREAFAAGDGSCSVHLEIAVHQALRADGRGEAAAFLIDDALGRLESLGDQLAEYNRKRDYRYAVEHRGEEQRSWTKVIRRYVGGGPKAGWAPNDDEPHS